MSRHRLRTLAVLAVTPLLLSVLPGTHAAADPAPPSPGGSRSLPEGPWPPDRVLAMSPDSVVAPEAAATTSSCPTPPYGVQSRAPGSGRTVALTFDDGPGPSTWSLLNVLTRYGVPATFFNIGLNQVARPNQVRAEQTMSYALGNHTWSHPEMPTLSYSAQATEMDRTTAEQNALTGQPSCVFRPPYGAYDTDTLDAAYARKMAVWNWSVDTEDWKADVASSYWVNRIISLANAGSSQTHPVILMHNAPDGNAATVAALPAIIEHYQSLGYTFVDLLGHAGYTLPAPVGSVDTSGRHVFYRGSNGAVYERSQANGTWQAARSLGGNVVDGPAAVAVGGSTVVFAQGTDNQLWQNTVTGTGASGWSQLGGLMTSRPAAAVTTGGRISVIARGADRTAWMRERVNGQWGSWQSLGGLLTSAPAAAVTSTSDLTVVAASTNSNSLWQRHRSATGWGSWTSLGGGTNADPGLLATADRAGLVLVIRGLNNAAYIRQGNATATSWTAWSGISGALYSGFGGFAEPADMYAIAYGTDRALWAAVSNSGTSPTAWSWRRIG